MKKGTRLVTVGLAALIALAVAATATAAYNTAKLSVTYTGTVTRVVVSSAVGDDATARASIVIPTGTTITAPATPGAKVGTVKAQVSALALGGALLPLEGDMIIAPPGAVPAASQAACTGGVAPVATLAARPQGSGPDAQPARVHRSHLWGSRPRSARTRSTSASRRRTFRSRRAERRSARSS